MSAMQQQFEITRLSKLGGPLSKRIYINGDGKVVSDGSACTMSAGTASRVRFQSLPEVAGFISKMPSTDAIALGRLRDDLDGVLRLTTQAKLASLNGNAPATLIARTANFIRYQPGQPAVVLIDIDTKGMPDAVKARVAAAGGFWPALCSVLPSLATTARIVRNSTSSGLSRIDTGETFPGSGGQHIYLAIADGADAERFLYALHERCWLAGIGWHMVGAGGQLLDRSLVDRMVHAAERLVFEGAPVVETPLQQDQSARAPDRSCCDSDHRFRRPERGGWRRERRRRSYRVSWGSCDAPRWFYINHSGPLLSTPPWSINRRWHAKTRS
jgi:hypothetical protein